MDEAQSVVTDAARSLSMDEAVFLTTDAARSLSKDGVASLTTEVAGPFLMDMAQSLVMDWDLSHMMDEEKINNQPNLLINDYYSIKQHCGPTNFWLLQKNKQRNCKDMRKTLVKKQQISKEAVFAVCSIRSKWQS